MYDIYHTFVDNILPRMKVLTLKNIIIRNMQLI